MEEKRRSKRAKPIDEGYWDCSVCTYKNSPEAFKCDMCDVRKGTSTRKPRLNAQLVAQQAAQQYVAPPKKDKPNHVKKDRKESGTSSGSGHHKKSRHPARLKNIDKSTATSVEVTVNNLTVIITDYTECKLKKERRSSADTTSSNQLTMSTPSIHSDSGDSNMSTIKSEVNGDIDMMEEGVEQEEEKT